MSSIYLQIQDKIYRKHFADWLADPSPDAKPYQFLFRDLNMHTSLKVFCGDYISDENCKEISDKYWLITKALELVNFPFPFPGTKVWHAIQARKITVRHLSAAAAASKKNMLAGGEANCLLDHWVNEILAAKRYREGKDQGVERPNLIVREYSDYEMSLVLFSFIFASQDAMSSSITYGFQHLADYPDVLAKVREEQYRVRGTDVDSAITIDQLDDMPYTNAVCREVLRHRPPVIMVPYKTTRPFAISDDYTVPSGTMIIPSFWNSLHDPEVYPDPESFKPERWMPGGANQDSTDSKNWLVFGAGAHRCIGAFCCLTSLLVLCADFGLAGQSYVMMHMAAVFGSASMLMDWKHERTELSDEIK